MILAWLLFTHALATPAATQTVRLEVASDWHPPGLRIEAETVWLGEARRVELRDDGTAPGDAPEDGVWVAEWAGDAVRLLPVRLFVAAEGVERVEVAASVEALATPEDRIVWVLGHDGEPYARRAAAALRPREHQMAEATSLAAGFGWVGLLLVYVGWLSRRMPATGGKP